MHPPAPLARSSYLSTPPTDERTSKCKWANVYTHALALALACTWYSHCTLAHRSHPARPPNYPFDLGTRHAARSVSLGSLSRRQRRQRNALSLLAFALPLPCPALPCLACLACLALPCLRLLPRLSCMFFFLLVSRSPNSYRPARRAHAQIFFLSL